MSDGSIRPWERLGARLPLVGPMFRGIVTSRGQVATYARAWDEGNRSVVPSGGRVWAVLGDSAAQGIGAPSHMGGYVGQLRRLLEERSGHAWQVLNLSRSGARAADLLEVQLPRLGNLDLPADLVTCVIGGNDLLHTRTELLLNTFRSILAALPPGAVIATMPQGLGTRRAQAVNALIRAEAGGHNLVVADLYAHTGPPYPGKMAADQFHPNERGYADWTRALAEVISLDGESGALLRKPSPGRQAG